MRRDNLKGSEKINLEVRKILLIFATRNGHENKWQFEIARKS